MTPHPGNSGFVPRNDPSLIIVPNWAEFVLWASDGGYDESYFDINHEKCLALQEQYNAEMVDLARDTGDTGG